MEFSVKALFFPELGAQAWIGSASVTINFRKRMIFFVGEFYCNHDTFTFEIRSVDRITLNTSTIERC
jgi:hypothetical protein